MDNVFEPPAHLGGHTAKVGEGLSIGMAAIETYAADLGHVRLTAEHVLAMVFTQPEVVWGLQAHGLSIRQADRRVHAGFANVPSFGRPNPELPLILETLRILRRARKRCDGELAGVDLLAALVDQPIPWYMRLRAVFFGHRDWRSTVLELPIVAIQPVYTPPSPIVGAVFASPAALDAPAFVAALVSQGVFLHVAVRLWLTRRRLGVAGVPEGVNVDALMQQGVSVQTPD